MVKMSESKVPMSIEEQNRKNAMESALDCGQAISAGHIVLMLDREARKPTTERRTLAEMAEAIRRMYL